MDNFQCKMGIVWKHIRCTSHNAVSGALRCQMYKYKYKYKYKFKYKYKYKYKYKCKYKYKYTYKYKYRIVWKHIRRCCKKRTMHMSGGRSGVKDQESRSQLGGRKINNASFYCPPTRITSRELEHLHFTFK